MDRPEDQRDETYNPWSIVNLVFHHLADQGLHPVLGSAGDPGCGPTNCSINRGNGVIEKIGACGTYEGTCACFATGYIQFGAQTGCFPQ